jgi:hypothetical protein
MRTRSVIVAFEKRIQASWQRCEGVGFSTERGKKNPRSLSFRGLNGGSFVLTKAYYRL